MEIGWFYGQEFNEKLTNLPSIERSNNAITKVRAQAFGYAYAVGRPTQRVLREGNKVVHVYALVLQGLRPSQRNLYRCTTADLP